MRLLVALVLSQLCFDFAQCVCGCMQHVETCANSPLDPLPQLLQSRSCFTCGPWWLLCLPPTLQLQAVFLPLKLAYHYLSQYKCRDALKALGALPHSQRCSAGVLLLMARCLYELVDYARAAEAFEAARTADPLNIEVRCRQRL